MPDPPQAERNAGFAVQPGLQLGQRQIGLRCQTHSITRRCVPASARNLRPGWCVYPFGMPTAVPLCGNLLRPAHTYQEAIRKLLQRLLALIVGQQKLTAQVISIWLRHQSTCRRVLPKQVYTITENALELVENRAEATGSPASAALLCGKQRARRKILWPLPCVARGIVCRLCYESVFQQAPRAVPCRARWFDRRSLSS